MSGGLRGARIGGAQVSEKHAGFPYQPAAALPKISLP